MVLTTHRRHDVFRDSYFDRVATDLWEGRWDAIIATRSADDQERLFIEATILCKYGRSLSLRGSPEKVREVLATARAGRRQAPLLSHVTLIPLRRSVI